MNLICAWGEGDFVGIVLFLFDVLLCMAGAGSVLITVHIGKRGLECTLVKALILQTHE